MKKLQMQNAKMLEKVKVMKIKVRLHDVDVLNVVEVVPTCVTLENALKFFWFPGAEVEIDETNEMPLNKAMKFAMHERATYGLKNLHSLIGAPVM